MANRNALLACREAGHAVALHLHDLPLQDITLDTIPDAEDLSPR